MKIWNRRRSFDPIGRAHRFHARVDAVIVVVAVAIGMVIAGWFADAMFTRTPEEAQFLGQSADIVAPETKTKIIMICGGFFSFIIWHFAGRDRL